MLPAPTVHSLSVAVTPPFCTHSVWGLTVKASTCNGAIVGVGPWEVVLSRCLEELCTTKNPVPSLRLFDVNFDTDHTTDKADLPILRRLTTAPLPGTTAITGALEVVRIAYNKHDDSADLAAFAAVASHLSELAITFSGLTSVAGLRGYCPALATLNVWGCFRLKSLDGLDDTHARLTEVTASWTAITSIQALRGCRALRRVCLYGCEQLTSVEGLEDLHQLEEIDISGASKVVSICELRGCAHLRAVYLRGCEQLDSLGDLSGLPNLEEVDASWTGITSSELRGCPSLEKLILLGCRQLPLMSTPH